MNKKEGMMQDSSTSPEFNSRVDQSRKPYLALRHLDVLVGTWSIKGRESGPG